jgi:stage II sporulation protein D
MGSHSASWKPNRGSAEVPGRANAVTGRWLIALAVLQIGGCHTSSGGPGHPDSQVVSTADRRMRVRLDSIVPAFSVAVENSGCLLDDDQGHSFVAPLATLSRCVVKPDSQEANVILVGGIRVTGSVLRILPDTDGSLIYNDRRYRGYLVVRRTGDGFMTVNVVDIESYLRGVLRGELPRHFHAETYHVQAIVSRTYALYQRHLNGSQRLWDVTADTSSQVYHGIEGESSKSDEAVLSTEGIVCAWDSPQGRKIFCTYFSSTCGGANVDVVQVKGGAAVKPLSGGVTCPYCKQSEWYLWEPKKVSKERITNDVKPYLVRGGYSRADKLTLIDDIKVIQRTASGRPVMLRLTDRNGLIVDMRAEDFRLILDNGRLIKSTQFEIVNEGAYISFVKGRGYGHGIGMCQHGAEGMARKGRTAGQILQYYYPGCVLVKAY